jgi:hypothetical protein
MHEGDPWKVTYYHRVVQTRIGRALRERYDLSQPLPDRLSRLLMQIDEQDREADQTSGENADESRRETKADAASIDGNQSSRTPFLCATASPQSLDKS